MPNDYNFATVCLNSSCADNVKNKDIYLALYAQNSSPSIDYALANIWGWANYFKLEWAFHDNLCWIRQTHPYPALWAPVGDWNNYDFTKISLFQEQQKMIRIPEKLSLILKEQFGENIEIQEERDQWEYLYLTKDLASLLGNKYHKKRNHVNAYKKTYGEPNYKDITIDNIDDVLALEDEWCKWRECSESKALQAENEAINRVLANWSSMPALVGGALYVDDLIVAFSIGEKLDEQTLGIHYEKGRLGYKGVYQMMNNAFAKRAGTGYTYLNRAQDLGEEGLRKAKSSYMPTDFVRKYIAHINKIS